MKGFTVLSQASNLVFQRVLNAFVGRQLLLKAIIEREATVNDIRRKDVLPELPFGQIKPVAIAALW